jgi:hypothetical protein
LLWQIELELMMCIVSDSTVLRAGLRAELPTYKVRKHNFSSGGSDFSNCPEPDPARDLVLVPTPTVSDATLSVDSGTLLYKYQDLI